MKIFNHKISFTRLLLLAVFFTAISLQVNAQDNKVLAAVNDNKVKVEVFPNPTSNYLTIDLSKLSLDKPKIEIRNIIGSKMQAQTEKLNGKKYRIDVQDYPAGYYLVLVRDDKTKFQQTVRFSKK